MLHSLRTTLFSSHDSGKKFFHHPVISSISIFFIFFSFFTVRNFISLQIYVENRDYSKSQIFTRRDFIMISLVSVISIALAISVRDAAAAKTPEKPSSQVSLLHVYMCVYSCKGMICYGVYFPREVSGYLVKTYKNMEHVTCK